MMLRSLFFAFCLFTTIGSFAQTEWLLYTRTVRDSQGNFRFDQNIVPNIKLNNVLRLELGIRHGETTGAFDAYYHYKIELQSKYFWSKIRFLTRLSDNIVKAPAIYSKSNYIAIAESRFPFGKFTALVGAGGVASFQRSGVKDAAPSFNGARRIFPTYRVTLRYHIKKEWHVGVVYGAYDTFNPYYPESPFLQVDSEYELTHRVTLYGYFRYQYDHHVDAELNDFLGLGIRLRR
jgi:hypothetical protein